MADNPNNDTVRDYYRAMGEGDFAHVVSLHDPDVTCWMSGTSLVSGRFEQREALYAHMGEHVLGPLVGDAEPYVKGSRLILADGEYTVGLLHGGLPAQDGGRYDQFYLQVFRFERGLIREIVEIFDTVMVETTLMKNNLAKPRATPEQPFDLDAPACTSSLDRDGMIALGERFAQALSSQSFDEARSYLSVDPDVRVIGSTPFSGRTSDASVIDRVFADGLSQYRIVAADGGAAVVLARAAQGYPQQYGLVIEAQGEGIGCLSIFLDTVAAEAHQFGNRMVPSASTSIKPAFDVLQAFRGNP
jgi:ketosteroid isomerase-like protein